MQSENINELAMALAKAQGEIKPAMKSSMNPFYKSKYADLSEFWEACREPLSKNGLAIIQTMDESEKGLILITTLAHSSGQWIKSKFPLICNKPNDIQAFGSSITYVRRYTLAAIVGICPDEDDDGNKAIPNSREEKPTVKKKTIEKEKWIELNKLIDQCSSKFQENTWKRLEAMEIRDFSQMDEETFSKFRDASLEHLSKRNVNEAS